MSLCCRAFVAHGGARWNRFIHPGRTERRQKSSASICGAGDSPVPPAAKEGGRVRVKIYKPATCGTRQPTPDPPTTREPTPHPPHLPAAPGRPVPPLPGPPSRSGLQTDAAADPSPDLSPTRPFFFYTHYVFFYVPSTHIPLSFFQRFFYGLF